jgi:hypothetical protein
VADPLVVGLHGVDWPAIVGRVRDEEPGVVVLTHFVPDEAAAFQRAFVAAGVRALVLMIYAPSLPLFRRDAGGAAEGVLWSTVTGTYSDAIGRAFRRRYAEAFGRPPGRSLAGSAYARCTCWRRRGREPPTCTALPTSLPSCAGSAIAA